MVDVKQQVTALEKLIEKRVINAFSPTIVIKGVNDKLGIYVVQTASCLVPCRYDEIIPEGKFCFWLRKAGRWSLVEISDGLLVELIPDIFSYRHIKEDDSDHTTGFVEIKQKDGVRLYSLYKQRFVISESTVHSIDNMSFTTYWHASPSTDCPKHIYYVCQDNKHGVFNIKKQKFVVPAEYSSVEVLEKQFRFFRVEKFGQFGVYDAKKGILVVPIEFHNVFALRKHLWVIQDDEETPCYEETNSNEGNVYGIFDARTQSVEVPPKFYYSHGFYAHTNYFERSDFSKSEYVVVKRSVIKNGKDSWSMLEKRGIYCISKQITVVPTDFHSVNALKKGIYSCRRNQSDANDSDETVIYTADGCADLQGCLSRVLCNGYYQVRSNLPGLHLFHIPTLSDYIISDSRPVSSVCIISDNLIEYNTEYWGHSDDAVRYVLVSLADSKPEMIKEIVIPKKVPVGVE